MNKIKVLIVEDSKSLASYFKEILISDEFIDVVGIAYDPYEARELIKTLNPDVITLDIEMPKMNGLVFLKNLMRLHPLPVIMLSSYTQKGSDITIECLQSGAFDYLPKPVDPTDNELKNFSYKLISKVILASKSNISAIPHLNIKKESQDVQELNKDKGLKQNYDKFKRHSLVAIGSSTGGVSAIELLLKGLPESFPPIIITQHLSKNYMGSFAKRLDSILKLEVLEVTENMPIVWGHVYIAPGDRHLEIIQKDRELYANLSDAPAFNEHKPSVEIMFESLLKLNSIKIVAILLTGMGRDGAQAMLKLHEAKVETIVQNEATSVVWGMPKAAIDLGAVDHTLAIDQIPEKLCKLLSN